MYRLPGLTGLSLSSLSLPCKTLKNLTGLNVLRDFLKLVMTLTSKKLQRKVLFCVENCHFRFSWKGLQFSRPDTCWVMTVFRAVTLSHFCLSYNSPLWSMARCIRKWGPSYLLLSFYAVRGQGELAFGKKTWQSSSLPELGANRAVDGILITDVRQQSCTQTSWIGTSDPWWIVDLGKLSRITAVSLTNVQNGIIKILSK